MTTRAIALCLSLAACGGAGRGGGAAHRCPPPPCPADDALLALAATAWAPSRDPENPWCHPLHVRGAWQWWIAGYAIPETSEAPGSQPHAALVTPEGAVAWREVSPYDEYYPDAREATAADLDGDGSDEPVYESTWGEGGGSITELIVVGVAGEAPVRDGKSIGSSGPDDGCTASWRIRNRRLVITGDGDCADHTTTLRWTGAALVAQ
jgi:hypothetical protein